MLQFPITGSEFVLELLLRGFRRGLQGRDLGGQRIDGFCGSRVFLDDGFGRVAQFLDLGLKGGELRQKLGIRFHRFRCDQNDFGLGRGQGLDGAEPVAFVLEDVRRGRGKGFLFLGLGHEIEQCTAGTDHEDDDQSEQR